MNNLKPESYYSILGNSVLQHFSKKEKFINELISYKEKN